ncbi:MAG: glucosamine-6-phosphate deaminase [Terriglobia bacterium]
MSALVKQQTSGGAEIKVFASKAAAGVAAAEAAAMSLVRALQERQTARLIVATGNSQLETVRSLAQRRNIEWSRVEIFHLDEYAGIPSDHPASFRRWIKEKLVDLVHPGKVHYIEGDAANLQDECARYGQLLLAAPIDVCLLGIGENGHLAFNDPHTADFNDPLVMKLVTLDDVSRRQQVGEGHFPTLGDVPIQALTLTIPALMSSRHLVCSVPERRKAEAVRNALQGPITPQCPASLLRTHRQAGIYLDLESASLLDGVTNSA